MAGWRGVGGWVGHESVVEPCAWSWGRRGLPPTHAHAHTYTYKMSPNSSSQGDQVGVSPVAWDRGGDRPAGWTTGPWLTGLQEAPATSAGWTQPAAWARLRPRGAAGGGTGDVGSSCPLPRPASASTSATQGDPPPRPTGSA